MRSLCLVLGVLTLVSCTDDRVPTGPTPVTRASALISDGARNGYPDFFWLAPTVTTTPEFTGPFDASALNQLTVEVCALGSGGACSNAPIEQITSQSTPAPGRIQLNAQGEYYSATWLSGRSHTVPGEFYRVRVLRSGTELGFLDVAIVQSTPALASVNTSLYTGLVQGKSLELRFRIQLPTARNWVKVNEVESSGGSPGDWIELHNTSAAEVSLAGYVIKDNDNSHVYTIPAGVTIAGNGYYVVEESAMGFGLGATDAARFFAPGGTLLIDSYSWEAHAVNTYGRCPDGTGPFKQTTSVTKGGPNDCSILVRINEVESSGGSPGDWVELYNAAPTDADISGYVFKDSEDGHTYTFPAGSTIAAGGYLVLEEAAFGFGLGAADAARLFKPDGVTIADSYSWTAHAATTYGRCPNGTGPLVTTASSTKGAANACATPPSAVKINEIESSGGSPGDWVELYNPGSGPADISGLVFRDNDNSNGYVIPTGTVIPANGYFVLEQAAFSFGLGAPDAARLFAADGSTLIDSFEWTAHATTTYGRCPDGTGEFTTTTSSTKGDANTCPGEQTALAWPGDPDIQTVDGATVFGGNLSGLTYEGTGTTTPGVLWAVRNGPGTLYRLVWNGTIWTPDPTNDWGAGKAVKYGDGTGNPDAEGVTFAGTGSAGGMYVSTERNNDANTISRNSILRFDVTAAGATLNATNEWNLTSDLPAVPDANLGIEAVTWIPDAFLTASGFVDESKNKLYSPADYANHGDGLFFVGLEANGMIYAYALNHSDNTFTRVATIATGLAGVMDLAFDRELNNLWAVCDNGCNGRSVVLHVATIDQPTPGRFVVTRLFERPTGMPNLNNEGFTLAPQVECSGGKKSAWWADDSEADGHAIRHGTVTCTPF